MDSHSTSFHLTPFTQRGDLGLVHAVQVTSSFLRVAWTHSAGLSIYLLLDAWLVSSVWLLQALRLCCFWNKALSSWFLKPPHTDSCCLCLHCWHSMPHPTLLCSW